MFGSDDGCLALDEEAAATAASMPSSFAPLAAGDEDAADNSSLLSSIFDYTVMRVQEDNSDGGGVSGCVGLCVNVCLCVRMW